MHPPSRQIVFPLGALFALVDGVRITESPDGEALAWDSHPPRRFPADLVRRRGLPISAQPFRTALSSAGPIAA